MVLDFSTAGEVNIDMIPYIQKVINKFPEKITGCNPCWLGIIYFMFACLPTY